ncbi:Sugar lactone lactonase YvrE [Muriicola jejuensis]|uniref:SMP-30/gluconolactonase/LRE family protein n=1 Tax=Muriicola jejuensis TaxID=504488 RepID=A0A6P0UE04_9FLAO|nr:SMP-30/gluconolactonase/LRE family protein [Muriicola jejuensis]NER09958.1 SMP-30/gluconolactonase/LRE family protein [Muriicola jejuensis]SMP04425.1 Sugar lactone lactonase YvrE [Muriicola jejuensis]
MKSSHRPVLIISLILSFWNPLHAFQSEDLTPEFSFTEGIEGPAVDKSGALYAVNYGEQGTIGRVSETGMAELYLTLPEGSIGNGIRFDREGTMYIADYAGHKVYRVKRDSKQPEVYVEGPEMNQPNDLALSDTGVIYLSDPNWGEGTGNLWMVPGAGELVLLESGMGTTNGIEVSPDGKYLYVNESEQRKVWKYDILPDGTLSGKKLLISFEDYGLDGMRCDVKGNLLITRYGKGTVVLVSPKGKVLKEIRLKGKNPSNLAFGGRDGRTVYVTLADRGCVEKIRLPHKGSYYSKIH